jgi:hypothetical protein
MAEPESCGTAEEAAVYGAVINRRVTIRRPARMNTDVAAAASRRIHFQKVRVHDISQRGIALVLRDAPAVGDMIALQMRNHLLGFAYDLAAEVRHVTPRPRGTWLVGLAFDRALSLGEFAVLI